MARQKTYVLHEYLERPSRRQFQVCNCPGVCTPLLSLRMHCCEYVHIREFEPHTIDSGRVLPQLFRDLLRSADMPVPPLSIKRSDRRISVSKFSSSSSKCCRLSPVNSIRMQAIRVWTCGIGGWSWTRVELIPRDGAAAARDVDGIGLVPFLLIRGRGRCRGLIDGDGCRIVSRIGGRGKAEIGALGPLANVAVFEGRSIHCQWGTCGYPCASQSASWS